MGVHLFFLHLYVKFTYNQKSSCHIYSPNLEITNKLCDNHFINYKNIEYFIVYNTIPIPGLEPGSAG